MTIYPPLFYARAFRKALAEKKGNEEEYALNLAHLFRKQGAFRYPSHIMRAIYKEIIRHHGGRWIVVETARILAVDLQKKIRHIFSAQDYIEERIRPDLIAGVRIIADGEQEYNGSLKRKLDKLLK